jgi:hypothetical protein
LVFVPHVPAFSPVAIFSTPKGVYVEAIIYLLLNSLFLIRFLYNVNIIYFIMVV